MSTDPLVFIIESLNPDDEGNGRFEGGILTRMLRLHDKPCKYQYVRTRDAFEKAVRRFGKSNYRYLHLSCHANSNAMFTTNNDRISFNRLGTILAASRVRNRRVFVSACEMVNRNLALHLIPNAGCLSVIGPSESIAFSDAAVFWASFYHLMFSHDDSAMRRIELLKYVRRAHRMFGVNIRYFSASRKSVSGIKVKEFVRNDQ
jgi:hypothetical protein